MKGFIKVVGSIFFLVLCSESVGDDIPLIMPGVDKGKIKEIVYEEAFGGNGELVVSVYLDDIKLTDAMFSLVNGDSVFYPLSELFSILEFSIFVDPESGNSYGWFIDANRSFTLDLENELLEIASERRPFPSDGVVLYEGDVFVTSTLLEKWFPLAFHTDLKAQKVTVESTEELPLQLARRRKEYQSRASKQPIVFGANLVPKIPKYRVFDWPALSAKISSEKSNGLDLGSSHRFTAFGDLLGLNGVLSISGSSDDSIENLYLTLGRRDATKRLLGPLKLSEFQLGDTGSSSRGLIGGGVSGLGVSFSNNYLFPKYYRDKVDFSGPLGAGYELELYLNDRFVSVFYENGTGKYSFEQIPLTRGENKVRLEFYGPSGERETEEETIYNDPNAGRFGELTYSGAFVNEGAGFYEDIEGDFDVENVSSVVDFSMKLGSRYAVDAMFLDRGKGVSQNYTLSAAVSKYYIQAELGIESDGDSAYSISFNEYYSRYAKGIRFNYYEEGFSVNGTSVPLVNEKWNIDFSLSKNSSYFTDKSSTWSIDSNLSGTSDFSSLDMLNLGLYYGFRKEWINISMFNSYYKGFQSNESYADGNINVGFNLGPDNRLSNRINIGYLSYPELSFSDASYGLGFKAGNKWSASARLGYESEYGNYSFSLGGERLIGGFSSTASFSKGSDGSYSIGFGVGFSVERKPGASYPNISRGKNANAPKVALLAFKDINSNGIKEIDEVGLDGLQVRVNGLGTSYYTDTSGYALVEGLSADRSYDVSVVEGSITDPSYRAINPEFGIVPRPGRLPVVYVPVVPTGEIEGVVNFRSKNKLIGAANLKLVIKRINADKVSTSEVFTEYDGVFNLAGLPLGDYQIELDNEILAAASLTFDPVSKVITLSEESSLIEGIEFVIEKK